MKLGCGHPMGPLTLLISWARHNLLHSQIMFEEFKEAAIRPLAPAEADGAGGVERRKSGRGFMIYSDPQNPRR